MRIICSLLLSLTVTALCAQRSITYTAADRTLTQVLKELEKSYGIHFAFAVDEVKDKKVSIDVEDETLESFLKDLFAQHQLSFEIVEEDFIAVTKASSMLLRLSLQDAETGEPLSFATARIKGTYQGYIADVNGKLEAIIKNPSETILEISYLGYKKIEIEVGSIHPNEPFTMALERDAQELQEIVVKEYLNKGITIDDRASKISIDVQDMEILPGLSERDILLSAQILAGIGSADESAGGMNVRGSSRDNTFIYWNKIPVYQPAHYFGNISAFIPSSIGKVDIYKNYVPVSYGGSSSGLLLVNSRSPVTEKPVIETNLNLTHGDLYTSLPFAKQSGRISIAARRSFNDLILTPTFNSISNKLFEGSLTEDVQGISDDFEYNSKLVFNDLNLVVDFKPVGNNEFSASLLSSRSKLDYNSEDEEDVLQSIQSHNVQTFGSNFTWTRRWADAVSSEVSTSYADYHMDYSLVNIRQEEDEVTENDTQARINDLENFESRIKLTYAPIKNHVIDGGYQFNKIRADLTIDEDLFFEEDFTESIKSNGRVHGVFANYFGKFKSGLQLGAGVRYNAYEILNDSRIDRQLRINYELSPGILFKSSAGVYHQYISSLKEVDFVFSNTIEQNWITAEREEGIPVIKNEQIVLGVLFTKAGWVIDVDAYHKQVFAPVAWNFGFRIENDEVLVSGNEKINGIDLTVKKRWKYYRAWLSYTFQDSEVEAREQIFTSGLNLRHQLQLSQTMNYKQFEFSLGYTVRSGLPYTQALGFEQVFEEDDEPFFEIDYEPINASRLPAYHRVDVSAWYKLKRKQSSRFSAEFGVSILNLFDSSNLYSRAFTIDEDEDDQIFILQSDRKLIGITPNVSVRLKF